MSSKAQMLLACLAGMAVVAVSAPGQTEINLQKQFGLSRYVDPEFPGLAQDQGILVGLASIAVAWNDDGSPSDVVVLRANDPSFGKAARDAAWQWRRDAAGKEAKVAVYELKFTMSGVVVSRSYSAASRAAEREAENPAPLHVPTNTDLDSPLKAIAQPMPAFPAAAKGRWDEGRVVVEFYVDESGHVRAPTVREATAPEFAAEALNALQQWQYETPRKNGQPAVMSERWAFSFRKSG